MLVFENGNAAEHEKQQPMSKASVLAVEGLNKSRRTKEAHATEHENAFVPAHQQNEHSEIGISNTTEHEKHKKKRTPRSTGVPVLIPRAKQAVSP